MDEFESRFQQTCPPLYESASFRKVPCRFEQPSQNQQSPLRQACPYISYCQKSAAALWRLETAFGRWIKVTLSEMSSSIVVRSEHHFNRNYRQRHGLRKHIYELRADSGEDLGRLRRRPVKVNEEVLAEFEIAFPQLRGKLDEIKDTEFVSIGDLENSLAKAIGEVNFAKFGERIASKLFSPLDCYKLTEGDKFGHYVGFVDLRPNSDKAPLALAVLGTPRKYRHDPRTFLITGNYGLLFGGPSFRATVYSMQEPDIGGSACAQVSVFITLGLLSDRGAQLKGTYTLTYLGNKQRRMSRHEPSNDIVEGESVHLGDIHHAATARESFIAGGIAADASLNPYEIAGLLEACGTSSTVFNEKATYASIRLADKLIRSYVAARFPVILSVNSGKWWPWAVTKNVGHAVVVVGFREGSREPGETVLITHDPGYVPYYECSFRDAIEASRHYSDRDLIVMVFSAHESVRMHAKDCIHALISEASPDNKQIKAFVENSEGDTDYEIDLVVRDELSFFICGTMPNVTADSRRQIEKDLRQKIEGGLERARYWLIRGLRDGILDKAWLFNCQRFPRLRENGIVWDGRITSSSQEMKLEYFEGDTLVSVSVGGGS